MGGVVSMCCMLDVDVVSIKLAVVHTLTDVCVQNRTHISMQHTR